MGRIGWDGVMTGEGPSFSFEYEVFVCVAVCKI